MQDVQGLGQQDGKIVMSFADADPAIVTAGSPQLGRSHLGQCFGSDRKSQIQPQSLNRIPMIVELASSFGGLSFDSRRDVTNHNRRFGLIAMLTAGAPSSFVPDFAIAQQDFDGDRRRVNVVSRR